LEKDQISRFCITGRNVGAASHQTICRLSANIANRVIDYPADLCTASVYVK
jgi:hypothetical protein